MPGTAAYRKLRSTAPVFCGSAAPERIGADTKTAATNASGAFMVAPSYVRLTGRGTGTVNEPANWLTVW
jgi:hypothetical protein